MFKLLNKLLIIIFFILGGMIIQKDFFTPKCKLQPCGNYCEILKK